ncbi:Uncharacterized protein BP5553_09669 [Venustampulla echinocandica]|uniref:PNPLA domain-containing protein n=1 Tax=Venustampulla echinocandica TaxID=2656787 RepID=A0A370TBN9_9HELO|nr:Uncharacterized protein BP5553_09669 [Venustampulla echinocandica]RDL31460.1 Uncharacterized protein BP5553_09669 [Venustampulla echinocandica]
MANNNLRLLALDGGGGGVRGLSALMILQQLMETIDPENPPKPCDYFDMIGGTSTGGLIAIMLGRLKMSIDDCINAYLLLSDRIFHKKRHRFTVKGNIQGRFDSEELSQAVKEVVIAQQLDEDTLLKDVSEDACKVFMCATSKQTSESVCLTSYNSPGGGSDLLDSVKIWEACRATSAASTFFDPIAIGRHEQEFVDGATGANNPIWEVWNQAQLIWGPQPLENRIRYIVSIGTGVPSLKPFRDDVLHFGKTRVAIATETEQTAERFLRDKSQLDKSGQYYRFNVDRGLEQIGLQESKKKKEIAAATRRYIGSQRVLNQMQACAGNVARREGFGEYRIACRLEGVPRANKFVGRPVEMSKLERGLLPESRSCRQNIFVLHGLGGIGKTQLAVEFAREHCDKFSAVFWLDGKSENSLKRSLSSLASRIPEGRISESSRTYSANSTVDINIVVREVISWFARQDNTDWLLIFDNVDRDSSYNNSDPGAYYIRRYFPSADHGTILITSRLAKLEQLGGSHLLGKVDQPQATAIFQTRYKRKHNLAEIERLLDLLDGLPLAIAQWKELIDSHNGADAPLQDYPDRSIWTTWVISYNAIREKHEATANLLLLWAFLNSKDLWHGLFEAACSASTAVATSLSEWIGDLANNKVEFAKAIQLLGNYSLIEDVKDSASYAIHSVVHTWAYYFQGEDSRAQLAQLATIVVGWASPDISSREYSIMQPRLLPHAQACSQWTLTGERRSSRSFHRASNLINAAEHRSVLLDAIHRLGLLYADQNRPAGAKTMLQRALQGYKKALGVDNITTYIPALNIMWGLGSLFERQGDLANARIMYSKALVGYERVVGPDHLASRSLRDNLQALDTVTENETLNNVEELIVVKNS